MDLATMRGKIRKDLHDEDPQSYRWTDAVLDRHIAHAVRELSFALPREEMATLSTTTGSRDLPLSSLADLVQVEAVEYPTGKYPPSYAQFSIWKDTLTILMDQAPGGIEQVKVYYGRVHTLDDTTSTIPPSPGGPCGGGSGGLRRRGVVQLCHQPGKLGRSRYVA